MNLEASVSQFQQNKKEKNAFVKKFLLKRGTFPPAASLNVLFSYAFWNQNVITVKLLKLLEASMFNQVVICPMPNETK